MEQSCLVCDANINIASSVNVNNTTVKYSDNKLATIVVNVLGSETPVNSNSSICGKCYNLFKLYEQAQWTVQNTKREILKIHQSKVNNVIAKREERDINLVFKEEPQIQPDKFSDKFAQIQPTRKPDIGKAYTLKNYFECAAKDLTEKSDDEHSYQKVSSDTPESNVMIITSYEQEQTLPVKKAVRSKGAKQKTEKNKIGN